MIEIRTLDDMTIPQGARVFYRVDYNVPIEDGHIADTTRIDETLPTLRRLRTAGARILIASHFGRPKGQRTLKDSLAPLRDVLADRIGSPVAWADDCIGNEAEAKSDALGEGDILLLENLRFHPEEEKNDAGFAAELRKLADFYVNDAFGACHRAHASIAALPRLFQPERIGGGLLLMREVEFLQKITRVEQRPFVAVIGGAKIAGKMEAVETLVKQADTVLFGGGLANTFLAAKGIPMGGSLVDTDELDVAKRILEHPERAHVELPIDLVVADDMDNPTVIETVDSDSGLRDDQKAFDIGPRTVELYTEALHAAHIVFWNGPMGVFEKQAFRQGTMDIAHAVADAHGTTVVGGGESVEAAKMSGFADRISHISTGGGASLDFISGEPLPGVEVLRR